MDNDYYTDGPSDERCHDCGSLLPVCRCVDIWDEERYLNGDDTYPGEKTDA